METHRDSPSTSATSSLPRNATTPCPFCGLSFKRLGSHLSRCKQRGGRDYSVYLSRQPVRDPRPKRAKCPKCLRFFRRLDTHLRVSASCRDVSITTAVRAETGSSSPGAHELSVSVPVPDPPRELPHLKLQRPLKLPKTAGEWVEADELLAAVAPAVISCRTAEEKNDVLVGMSYSILCERFDTRQQPRARKRLQGQLRQHNRALKRVTALKNSARQALRRAKRENASAEHIHSCAGQFLSLLREHSQLKRQTEGRVKETEARMARKECHSHFWRFAKSLLDNEKASSISPAFSPLEAHNFFTDQYSAQPHDYSSPVWMPSPPSPQHTMSSVVPVSQEELVAAIKRSRSASASSPLDQIPYQVFKKCSSLVPALLDLFNTILTEGVIPTSWKVAVFRLIGKSAASEDPHCPQNFRPIALTPAISKLLSGILKDRWLNHMVANVYLDPAVQKAFLPTIPGVTEHQCKLAAIISGARQSKRSLAVAWLDIENAYGSVHHSLIQFALRRYHAPPDFCNLLQSWYTDVAATISTAEWESPVIPLKIGVLQGDPLSVVIFLTWLHSQTCWTPGKILEL